MENNDFSFLFYCDLDAINISILILNFKFLEITFVTRQILITVIIIAILRHFCKLR